MVEEDWLEALLKKGVGLIAIKYMYFPPEQHKGKRKWSFYEQ